MCTVSFIPQADRVIITSNRDEHVSRPTAYEPREALVNDCRILYPRDPKAGGTWFAVNEDGMVGVLLNGAFEKHESRGPYRRSRGLVLLDLLSTFTPVYTFENKNLRDIEPFTVVLFASRRLVELRWDGSSRYRRDCDPAKPHIWSSTTLYEKEAIRKREGLFDGFADKEVASAEGILDFHSGHHNDPRNGFVINRGNELMTFSITQAVIDDRRVRMHHHDLRTGRKYDLSMEPAPERAMMQ